jgi:hypothetical protein
MLGSCIRDREARADRQGRELIDRVAAGAPVGELFFIEALRHARVPFAGVRPDHRAGIELTAIDAHRPTSNVDSMTVFRARRGGTGSK